MQIKITPKTCLGRLSCIFIFSVPIFFYLGIHFVALYRPILAGRTIIQDIMIRPGVALSMLAGILFGILAFFLGFIAIVKKNDYSLCVFLSTIIGFLLLFLFLGEILFPH